MEGISIQGRLTQGVSVIGLAPGDAVASVAVIEMGQQQGAATAEGPQPSAPPEAEEEKPPKPAAKAKAAAKPSEPAAKAKAPPAKPKPSAKAAPAAKPKAPSAGAREQAALGKADAALSKAKAVLAKVRPPSGSSKRNGAPPKGGASGRSPRRR